MRRGRSLEALRIHVHRFHYSSIADGELDLSAVIGLARSAAIDPPYQLAFVVSRTVESEFHFFTPDLPAFSTTTSGF